MLETKFKKYMEENAIDSVALAKVLHTSVKTIYNFRANGLRNKAWAYALCFVLKCEPSDIMESQKTRNVLDHD